MIVESRARAFMFASSSKGNCALISCGGDSILIDAGISAKRINGGMALSGVDISTLGAVFITHEHSDHIGGLEVLYHSCKAPIYAPFDCIPAICSACPSAEMYLTGITPEQEIQVGCMTVTAYTTPHDSAASVGYRIRFPDGSELGYATDIGHITQNVVSILEGCRYVVVESNHDIDMLQNGSYSPCLKRRIAGANGHLANQSIKKMLPYLVLKGTKRIVLAHLSEENNTPDAAFISAASALTDYGYKIASADCEGDVSLTVALPSEIIPIIL